MTADDIIAVLDGLVAGQRIRLVFDPGDEVREALGHLLCMADPDRRIICIDRDTNDALKRAMKPGGWPTPDCSFVVGVTEALKDERRGRSWFICRLGTGLVRIELV